MGSIKTGEKSNSDYETQQHQKVVDILWLNINQHRNNL